MAANPRSDQLVFILKQLQERKTVKPEDATKALTQYYKVKDQIKALKEEIDIFKANRAKQSSPQNDTKDQNKRPDNQPNKDKTQRHSAKDRVRHAPTLTATTGYKTLVNGTKPANGPYPGPRRLSEPAAVANQKQITNIRQANQQNSAKQANGSKQANGPRRGSVAPSPVRENKGNPPAAPRTPRNKDDDPLQAKLAQQAKDITEKDQEIARLRFQNAQLKVTMENKVTTAAQAQQGADTKSTTSGLERVNFPLPQKLVVDFKVIYENEWKNAFHDLAKHYKLNEDAITELLAAVAKEANTFCQNVAQQQIADITKSHAHVIDVLVQPKYVSHSTKDVQTPKSKAIIDKDGYQITRRFLKQYRRAMARVPISGLTELFEGIVQKEVLTRHSSLRITPKSLRPYIHRLVEVDWLMSISEPPMFQLWPRGGQLMNREMFVPYDKKGATIIHTVWPAVLMYKDGPVADRGVCVVK